MPPSRPKIEFLASMITVIHDCWVWKKTEPSGCGYCYVKPGPKRLSAHRWVYECLRGPIPEGYILHHAKCWTKKCVNPDHMQLVTKSTHPDDTAGLNRAKTHCKRGHEFTPENTYKTTQGSRGCLICRKNYDKNISDSHAKRDFRRGFKF